MLHNLKGEIVNQTTTPQYIDDVVAIKKLILDTVKKAMLDTLLHHFPV